MQMFAVPFPVILFQLRQVVASAEMVESFALGQRMQNFQFRPDNN